jgi:hypothetical protein
MAYVYNLTTQEVEIGKDRGSSPAWAEGSAQMDLKIHLK